MSFNLATILAKQEVTYGTDPTPASGTNDIWTEEPQLSVANLITHERKPVLENLNEVLAVQGPHLVALQFKQPVHGIGAGLADTPPPIGTLLKSCGYAETTDSTGGAEWTKYILANPSAHKSLTMWMYHNDILHKMVGARGSVSLMGEAGKPLMASFNFLGKPGSTFRAASALPGAQALPSTIPPVLKAVTMTIGGTSVDVASFELSTGPEPTARPSVTAAAGFSEIKLVGRRACRLTVSLLRPALGTKDFLALQQAMTEQAIVIGTVGTARNNDFKITATEAQLLPAPETENTEDQIGEKLVFQINDNATDGGPFVWQFGNT